MGEMKALVVDDEKNISEILSIVLSEFGFNVKTANSFYEFERLSEEQSFDLALVDLRLPDGNGIDILKEIKEKNPNTEVIIITAFATPDTAVKAMKLGAYDYIQKPFSIPELKLLIRNVKNKIELEKKLKEKEIDEDIELIGKSKIIKNLKETIRKIAPYDINVLITGESGTGKTVIAKLIHRLSPRKEKPFLSINCASIPEELLESELFGHVKGAFTGAVSDKKGLLEIADGGTIFLDEIGEMPLPVQAKLLHFLEERKFRPVGGIDEISVDVRIISATNKDLEKEIEKGRFREDLYYRIAGIVIRVPPLRERREDIPEIAEIFIKEFSKKYNKKIEKIDKSFMAFLSNYEFKGNIRELRNIVEKEVILSENGVLKCHHCPYSKEVSLSVEIPPEGVDIKKILEEIEKAYILKALELSNGNKTKAAELLGLNLREFRYRLEKYLTPKS